ncbi:phosphate transport system permease protein PstC [bacterium BMS3Bbin02]|nr:phosphate transport system permease protein PstC [bacterium BMS3Bbin02]HDH27235.1 phosphate ABC transporter permease subunit PstC [Actinomycetota bacterium]
MQQIDLSGNPKRHRRERRVRRVLLTAASASLAVSVAIVVTLLSESATFFSGLDFGDGNPLWTLGWFPRRGLFDLLTIVGATILITLLAMVVAGPLGLGTATYLSEFAKPRARRLLKPIIEVLAGIPSVVIGFFALVWISPNIVQRFTDASVFSMAAAGIGVGVLTIPIIASIAEDAMRAVPNHLREASLGLGAHRSTTVRRVVYPAAASGIIAAMILGISRAIGETMVVFMAAGAVGGSLRTFNIFGPGQTMTAAIAALATGSDQVVGQGTAFQSLFAVALLLFLMTLILNVASDRLVRRVQERY